MVVRVYGHLTQRVEEADAVYTSFRHKAVRNTHGGYGAQRVPVSLRFDYVFLSTIRTRHRLHDIAYQGNELRRQGIEIDLVSKS